MKSGPRFVVDTMSVYQILTDKKFWIECPEFEPMREEGQVYRKRMIDQLLSQGPNCKNCSTLSTLQPYFLQFTRHVFALFVTDASNTKTFVDYITRKRGYRPIPIIVYTVDTAGKSLQLEL